MPLTETNVYALWAAKQTAKGVPATVATRRFKHVAGTIGMAVEQGSENFSDLTPYGDSTDWLNSIIGQGQPSVEGGSDELGWLLWMLHGTETVTPSGTNEVQTVTIGGAPTGGTFTLTLDNRQTTPIAYNATAAAIQTALEALPNIGAGNVTVTGAGPYTVTFVGALAKRPIPNLTATHALTGGTTPTVTVAETTMGVNAIHEFRPQNTLGFWLTLWSHVGLGDVWRHKHNDGRIGGLTIEASTGTKALRATPSLLLLDPGEIFDTDPPVVMPTSPVLLYTDGTGNFRVNDVVMRGQSQFQVALNQELTPVYGDDTAPYDVGRGNPGLSIAATVAVDQVTREHYNRDVYGTPNPAAGTKPIRRIPPVGSYSLKLDKKDSASNSIASFDAQFPGVRWSIPDAPGPNPDQGTAEISLAGQVRRIGTQDLYTIKVANQSAAYTA